jgi:uncharacterized membrane-anchored protein
MAQMWQSKSKDVLEYWITSSLEEGDLTKWETNFLESIDDQLSRSGKLSERQQEILEKIYVEKVK